MVATVIVGMLCAHLLCFSAMFWLIGHRLEGSRMGMGVFALGNLMLGCAYVLQLLGGGPDGGWLSVLNHTLTLAAPVAFGLAAARFFGFEVHARKWLLLFALAYTALQCAVQWGWGLQVRYALLSGTAAVMFLGMAVVVLYGSRTFAQQWRLEMWWFAALIAGIGVLNAIKLWKVWQGGLDALHMDTQFQLVFYIYMSFLATVLAPSIVWLVLRRLNDELRSSASLDALTQLLNRRGLDDALRTYFRLRRARPAYVLVADIDFFKNVNDTYGHHVGDEVLRQVAQTMRGAMRQGDLVCRFGGEEFVAVCLDTDAQGAVQMAERVRAAVQAQAIAVPEVAKVLHCTLTVGVSHSFMGVEGLPPALQAADAALYRGKAAGRNRVEVAAGPVPDLAPAQPLQAHDYVRMPPVTKSGGGGEPADHVKMS